MIDAAKIDVIVSNAHAWDETAACVAFNEGWHVAFPTVVVMPLTNTLDGKGKLAVPDFVGPHEHREKGPILDMSVRAAIKRDRIVAETFAEKKLHWQAMQDLAVLNDEHAT